MNVGIIIPCYNRPEYLKRCLDSVAASHLTGCVVVLVDDGSTDLMTEKLISDFSLHPGTALYKIMCSRNTGIKEVLKCGFDFLFSISCEHVINLDSDAIVKPNWLQVLLKLKSEHPNHIVSGFNSMNTNKDGSLRNPIIEEHEDYYLKKHCNGINMCMNKYDYETHIRPALQKPGNWDFNSTNKNGFIISKPSVVQHVGLVSSMGHNDNPDVAYDF